MPSTLPPNTVSEPAPPRLFGHSPPPLIRAKAGTQAEDGRPALRSGVLGSKSAWAPAFTGVSGLSKARPHSTNAP